MSRAADDLRLRREALLQRIESERAEFRGHLTQIETAISGVDRGLGLVRRLATRPVLLTGGIVATLLLGRGGVGRALASGMALLGFVLRVRSIAQTFTATTQERSSPAYPVRRSR